MKVVHRDVKPENIMINADHDAVLVDFGVSKLFQEDNDVHKETIGTTRYFAPEIVRAVEDKRIYGKKQDTWALGVTIYYAMTKKLPFDSMSIFGLQDQLLNEEPDLTIIQDQQLRNML
mmetsp:Transcript_41290/g.29756  ORF Transcript_41290/g.29756 Transcript_41290/m.29756 type:complete len:118 (-) Transcript_41290:46-399(-)